MWKYILRSTLIAGILDITAACIQAYLVRGTTPDVVCKFIASGLFGKQAFSGGTEYVLIGLIVHFFIVFACAAVYFILYPRLGFLKKSILLNALLIAIIAWVVTTQIIIPLSKIPPAPFDLKNVLVAIAILYCCIGLPITYFADRFYKSRNSIGRMNTAT